MPYKKKLNSLETYALVFACGTILTALLVENSFYKYLSWMASFFMIVFPVIFYFVWFAKYYFPIVWRERVKKLFYKPKKDVRTFQRSCLCF